MMSNIILLLCKVDGRANMIDYMDAYYSYAPKRARDNAARFVQDVGEGFKKAQTLAEAVRKMISTGRRSN